MIASLKLLKIPEIGKILQSRNWLNIYDSLSVCSEPPETVVATIKQNSDSRTMFEATSNLHTKFIQTFVCLLCGVHSKSCAFYHTMCVYVMKR